MRRLAAYDDKGQDDGKIWIFVCGIAATGIGGMMLHATAIALILAAAPTGKAPVTPIAQPGQTIFSRYQAVARGGHTIAILEPPAGATAPAYRLRTTFKSQVIPGWQRDSDGEACPAIPDVLTTLRAIDPKTWPAQTKAARPTADGISYSLTTTLPGENQPRTILWTSKDATPLTGWIEASMVRLTSCWQLPEM
jgi:hypothetical protein